MRTNNSLSTWRDGWSPISEFRREFDRLFDDWTPSSHGLRTESSFAPACDVEEAEDHYLLSLEMAGVKKEDVRIEVMDNQLFITGERKTESGSPPGGPLYRERRFGKFSRSFALPAGLDADKVEAHYQDGILRVIVPKVESAKPRQIQITNGGGASKFFGKFLNRSREREEAHSTNDSRTQAVAS